MKKNNVGNAIYEKNKYCAHSKNHNDNNNNNNNNNQKNNNRKRQLLANSIN